MSCIFCEIIKGNIPSMKVYEDDHSLVFMDIANDVDGHMLAIPKNHCKNVLDCDEENLAHVMHAIKVVADYLVKDCGYEGVNLLNASDECAGQTVFHLHFHIIPRKKDDGINSFPTYTGGKLGVESMYKRLRL